MKNEPLNHEPDAPPIIETDAPLNHKTDAPLNHESDAPSIHETDAAECSQSQSSRLKQAKPITHLTKTRGPIPVLRSITTFLNDNTPKEAL